MQYDVMKFKRERNLVVKLNNCKEGLFDNLEIKNNSKPFRDKLSRISQVITLNALQIYC